MTSQTQQQLADLWSTLATYVQPGYDDLFRSVMTRIHELYGREVSEEMTGAYAGGAAEGRAWMMAVPTLETRRADAVTVADDDDAVETVKKSDTH